MSEQTNKSVGEIEADIATTRARLASTIDELAVRAQPKEIARRQADSAMVKLNEATHTPTGQLRIERIVAVVAPWSPSSGWSSGAARVTDSSPAERLPIRMLHDRVLVSLEGEPGERHTGGGILIPSTVERRQAAVVGRGRGDRPQRAPGPRR